MEFKTWVEENLWIKKDTKQEIKFRLFESQKILAGKLFSIKPETKVLLVALTRQVGAGNLLHAYALYRAAMNAGEFIPMVEWDRDLAVWHFETLAFMAKDLPNIKVDRKHKSIEFSNGSKVMVKTQNWKPEDGIIITHAHFSHMNRWNGRAAEVLMDAVKERLAPNAAIVCEFIPCIGDYCHRLWRISEQHPEMPVERLFMAWYHEKMRVCPVEDGWNPSAPELRMAAQALQDNGEVIELPQLRWAEKKRINAQLDGDTWRRLMEEMAVSFDHVERIYKESLVEA